MDDRVRIFQIGMFKCGTTSIHRFYLRSGLRSVHIGSERHLAARMGVNIKAGRPIVDGFDCYDVYTDMNDAMEGVFGSMSYPQILRDYPGSKFILNTRDTGRWLRSMLSMSIRNQGKFLSEMSDDQFCAFWRGQREMLHANAVRDIPEERLLVFDIEKDDPVLLCRFAGLPERCARNWRRDNPTIPPGGLFILKCIPRPLKRMVPQEAKIAIVNTVCQWMRGRA